MECLKHKELGFHLMGIVKSLSKFLQMDTMTTEVLEEEYTNKTGRGLHLVSDIVIEALISM